MVVNMTYSACTLTVVLAMFRQTANAPSCQEASGQFRDGHTCGDGPPPWTLAPLGICSPHSLVVLSRSQQSEIQFVLPYIQYWCLKVDGRGIPHVAATTIIPPKVTSEQCLLATSNATERISWSGGELQGADTSYYRVLLSACRRDARVMESLSSSRCTRHIKEM
ncbi:hypothetical protein N657DRAFT_26958 [Parathielavia appendiculata]|uniref:Secreted protein n=1 Tax=Parathielavia appendiculata TaxID=2587402 RepID=A0AAN6U8U2_9PEZI|nr:hypothetical protein N657DRAFT_26958 [Parathielavia appendiculata]